MPKIIYVEHNGTTHAIEVAVGFSVMEGAVQSMIPGIDADCGGTCSCATCHVHVDQSWIEKTGVADDNEKAMLEFAQGADKRSRLSCQIKVSEALDGLVVQLPESQH